MNMKKISNLILLVFLYSVGANFNFAGFLASCAASSIVLESSSPNGTVNGFADLSGTSLSVTLYDIAQDSGTVKKPQVKIVVLQGDQTAAINAAVSANNP